MLTATTPAEIAAFRLLSLRGMLRMEKVGMKTRGGALRPRIAAEMNLKPRDSYEQYIAAIDAKLAIIIETDFTNRKGEV